MEDRTPPAAATLQAPKRGARTLWVIGLALVALLLAWQWYDARVRVNALRAELAQRVRDIEADSRDARLSAKQAQEAMREALAKVAQLDLRLSEYQNHQTSLEALYQELSRGRDDWVLADIEQVLVIASQQLQLVGNVPAALAALQTADARLARSGRAQFLPLRKAFAHDIERLKSAPDLDVPGMAVKLDQMIAGVDSLPLAQDMRPQPPPPQKAPPEGLWERLVEELLTELKQLVRVQKVDGTDAALLSPSQAYFLRENLKLRLLNARIALLARDEVAYRSDLDAAVAWLARYVDTRSGAAASMAASLKQLRSKGASPLFPTINESVAAVRAYKVPRERTQR
ncbi:MAG TPA: uroporphyrinogen-III C-methyltransferase [Burkholderiales bacterium]|nr:uroporphyrinogen-III C-methyltransferase [Burkholderiales bacterium]